MAASIVENKVIRPVANFSPSLWGDMFLNYTADSQVIQEYSKEIEVLEEEVRSMLTSPRSNMVETMGLINTLERLCLSYHFEDEIEEKLEKFFKLNTDYKNGDYDLYTVALHFRLFRAHGYHMSSDSFSKFIDDTGNFREALKRDAKGLLSLYEASYLRVHGENILDNALIFAIQNLKSMVQNLSSPLREEVTHALVQPLHLGSPRIEAHNFISVYGKSEEKNETLLRFAKLDYNLLQTLHKEELHEISRWWKDLDLSNKLPYARDRVVECYFWALGVYYEPQYSRSRVFLTKAIAMTSIIDDTYDSYGTIEELDIITDAIERWDISQIDHVPNYFKPFYKALLELYEQIEEELAMDGKSYAVYYGKETLKELVRSYHVEAKWFIQGHLPAFDQYLSNALITCTYYYHTTISLFGTKFATKEQYEWLMTKPKALVAGVVICRVIDDIATYEVEKERGQIATGIECYMKDNRVTIQEAMDKFFEMATNAWKDINEEFLKPSTCSRDVLTRILNLSRIIDVTYKDNHDGYTKPEKVLKPHIMALVVNPIQI